MGDYVGLRRLHVCQAVRLLNFTGNEA